MHRPSCAPLYVCIGNKLTSAESSAAVVGGLAKNAPRSDELRALLRQRDDLAFSILQAQRHLRDVREERAKTTNYISGTLWLTDLRRDALARDDPPADTAQSPDTARLRLLHGVLVGVAMRARMPWWQDARLAELVLSDP